MLITLPTRQNSKLLLPFNDKILELTFATPKIGVLKSEQRNNSQLFAKIETNVESVRTE